MFAFWVIIFSWIGVCWIVDGRSFNNFWSSLSWDLWRDVGVFLICWNWEYSSLSGVFLTCCDWKYSSLSGVFNLFPFLSGYPKSISIITKDFKIF